MSFPISGHHAPSAGAELLAEPLPTRVLRSWLQAQRRATMSGGIVGTAEVRRAMRLVADEAHRRDVRVEQVIVLLKQLWGSLSPEATAAGLAELRPGSDRELMEQIVRVLIEEYYDA